jgi:hypothetical protein
MTQKIIDMLKDTKYLRIDEDFGLILINYGGHGVSIFDSFGELRYFYNTGSFEYDNATEKDIIDSMEHRTKEKDYGVYAI